MNNLMSASSLAPAELRSRIQQFEDELLKHDQVDIPVAQFFSHGVYLRQITIPAGCLLTGKIHTHPCLSIVISGEMEVITDEGPKHVVGPIIYESPAGVKRAGKAITDCVWLTVHPYAGPERSPEQMAELLTVNTFAELLEHRHQEKIS
jgi:quercetin dioxygenase-like cupin family protein